MQKKRFRKSVHNELMKKTGTEKPYFNLIEYIYNQPTNNNILNEESIVIILCVII